MQAREPRPASVHAQHTVSNSSIGSESREDVPSSVVLGAAAWHEQRFIQRPHALQEEGSRNGGVQGKRRLDVDAMAPLCPAPIAAKFGAA